MANKRLVPMPPVTNGRRTSAPTPPPLQVKPPQSLVMQDMPYILLFVAAVLLWIYLKPWFMLALVITGFVLSVRGWVWLSGRFPMTMIFVNSFIAALLGGRRRRGW